MRNPVISSNIFGVSAAATSTFMRINYLLSSKLAESMDNKSRSNGNKLERPMPFTIGHRNLSRGSRSRKK
jgi:hypothetical protein